MAWNLVSIIVPALNEAKSLPELVLRIDRTMAELRQPYELLVIDDGSRDGTREVILKLKKTYPQLGLISHRANYGKSVALMQGFTAMRGNIAVTMDADLQDEPENLPALLEPLKKGYDLVGGWRHQRKDSLPKKFVSNCYNYLIRQICKQEFKDINCGLKAFTREVASCLNLHGDAHRLIPALAASYGFKIMETPVSHQPRKYGKSRYRLFRWRGILDLISFMILRSTQTRPFHAMCKLSFFSLALSMVTGACAWWLSFIEPGILRYFFRFVCTCATIFFGVLGLIAPMTGLILECLTYNRQNDAWRGTLVIDVLPPSAHEIGGKS